MLFEFHYLRYRKNKWKTQYPNLILHATSMYRVHHRVIGIIRYCIDICLPAATSDPAAAVLPISTLRFVYQFCWCRYYWIFYLIDNWIFVCGNTSIDCQWCKIFKRDVCMQGLVFRTDPISMILLISDIILLFYYLVS